LTVLATTSIVAPVYGVALLPDKSLSGPPGQTVAYSLTVTNTGDVVDNFNLALTGQIWTTTLSTALAKLAPSATQIFSVTVAIPPGAADQETDQVTVTATSQSDSSKTDSAVLTTKSVITSVYGIALSSDQTKLGLASQTVTYTLTLTNTGNVVESVDLLPTGNNWTTTLSAQVVVLAGGDSQAVTITVLIPPTAAALESDQVAIQALCRQDNSKNAIAVLTTVATGSFARNYLPTVLLGRPQ
jgi:hypothetical protein